jgi:hypothetical protein
VSSTDFDVSLFVFVFSIGIGFFGLEIVFGEEVNPITNSGIFVVQWDDLIFRFFLDSDSIGGNFEVTIFKGTDKDVVTNGVSIIFESLNFGWSIND